MIPLITAVFVASLVGSLHCAGMCGAFLAFAVGDSDQTPGQRTRLSVAYHGGRLATYTLLGAVAGGVGALLELGGALAGVSRLAMMLAGAVMVGFGLSVALTAMGRRVPRMPIPGLIQKALHTGHSAAMRFSPVKRALAIGLLTTLLPCGWLYAFAAVAAGTASPILGAVTMAVFWVGTLPVLVSLGMGVQRLAGSLGKRLPYAMSLVLILVGLWTLIVRGGLDASALASQQTVYDDITTATAGVDNVKEQTPDCCEAP